MMNHRIYSWLLPCAVVLFMYISDVAISYNHNRYKPTSSKRHSEGHHVPSKRDFVSAFNRENFVDSQDQYIADSTVASNQPPFAEIGRLRSDDGQHKMYLPEQDSYQDDRSNPFGDTQIPTLSSSDYRIAYSDGLPAPPTQRSSDSSLTYDIPADPLEESNANTVKIADPLASKKLFKDDGFSHGMGQLTNAINSILIDKVINSDADKDFTKELRLLTQEFAESDKSHSKNDDGSHKQKCKPDAKSIFVNCKKKRSAVCSPEDRQTFFKNALNIHNLFRKIHDAPELALNDKLSKDAQEYAEHLADNSLSVHSVRADRPGQGENIAVGCTSAGSELRAREAVSQWYSKACEKDFDFNGYKKGVEPFAQLVWKATTYLGMGKAVAKRNDNLCTYIVARYSPEGDKSSFEQNVLKGTFSRGSICNVSCVVKDDIPKETDSKSTGEELNVHGKVNNASMNGQKKVEQGKLQENPKAETVDQSSLSSNKVQSPPSGTNSTEKTDINSKQNSEDLKTSDQNINTELKSNQTLEVSKLSNADVVSNQQTRISPSTALDNTGNVPQNTETAVTVNKELEPKPPTLINITFPKELAATNNSVIQITLGDNQVKQAPASANLPTSFKPVVNFKGKDEQIVTSQDEFFETGDQNERFDEGKTIEKGPKFNVSFQDDGTEPHANSAKLNKEKTSNEDLGNRLAKEKSSDFTSKQEPNVVADDTANVMLNGNLGVNMNSEHEDKPSHEMFQDRKGNDFKNRDDSETYIKIANKLMQRDNNGPKDSTSEIFLPKQLEKSESGSFVTARKEADYGFTDEDVQTLSKEKELGDLLAAVKNKTSSRENSTEKSTFENEEDIQPSEKIPGIANSTAEKIMQNPEAKNASDNTQKAFSVASNDGGRKELNESSHSLHISEGFGEAGSVLKNDSLSKQYMNRAPKYPAGESSYMYNDKEADENAANEIIEDVKLLPSERHDSKYYSASQVTKQEDDKDDQGPVEKDDRKEMFSANKSYSFIHDGEESAEKGTEQIHNFMKDDRDNQRDTSREDATTNKKFVKIIDYTEAVNDQGEDNRQKKPTRLETNEQNLRNNSVKIDQQNVSYNQEGSNEKKLEHVVLAKQPEEVLSQRIGPSYFKHHLDNSTTYNDINSAKIEKADDEGDSFIDKQLQDSSKNRAGAKKTQESEMLMTKNAESRLNMNVDDMQQKLHVQRLGPLIEQSAVVDKTMNQDSSSISTHGNHVSNKISNEDNRRYNSGGTEQAFVNHNNFHSESEDQFTSPTKSAEQSDTANGMKLLSGSEDLSKSKQTLGNRTEPIYSKHREDQKFVDSVNTQNAITAASEPVSSHLNIPAKNIELNRNTYKHIANIVRNNDKDQKNDKSTTINVGNGFIDIRYDKSKFDEERHKADSHGKLQNSKGNALSNPHEVSFSSSVPEIHDNLKGDRNSVVTASSTFAKGNHEQERPHNFDAKKEVKDYSHSHSSDFSMRSDSEHHSLTPIIDRQNNHHYVIQFQPTHPSVEHSHSTSDQHSDGVPQYTAQYQGEREPHQATIGRPHASTEGNSQLAAEGKSQAFTKGKSQTSAESKLVTAAEGRPLAWTKGMSQAARGDFQKETEGRQQAAAKGKSQAATELRPKTATEGRLQAAAEGRLQAAAEGNFQAATERKSQAATDVRPQTATEGSLQASTAGKLQAATEGTLLYSADEKPQAAQDERPFTLAKGKPVSPQKVIPQSVAQRQPQSSTERSPVNGESRVNIDQQSSISGDLFQEDMMKANSEATNKNLATDRSPEMPRVSQNSKNLPVFHSFSQDFPNSKGKNNNLTKPADNIDIIKVDKNWSPLMMESNNGRMSVSGANEQQGHGNTNAMLQKQQNYPAEQFRENAHVGFSNKGKESPSKAVERPNDNTGKIVHSLTSINRGNYDQRNQEASSVHLNSLKASPVNLDFNTNNKYISNKQDSLLKGVPLSSRLQPQLTKPKTFSAGATVFQHPHIQSWKDNRLHTTYTQSDVQDSPVRGSYHKQLPIMIPNSDHTPPGTKGFSQSKLPISSSKVALNPKAFTNERQNKNVSPGAEEASKVTEDNDEFELTSKIKAGHELKALRKDGSKDTDIKDQNHYENQQFSHKQDDKKHSKQDSVSCKSNCPTTDSKSNQRYLSHQDSNDIHSVIGLNLVEGSNVFPDFKKLQDKHSLEGIIDKHAAATAASLRHTVGRELEHERTFYPIFIPEQALAGFRKEMTMEHNRYRRVHFAPSLVLSTLLSKDSQRYANELALRNSVVHSPLKSRPYVGESIEKVCTKNGGMPSATDLIKRWYDEVCKPGYNFEKNVKQPGTGHFTQLVWQGTKKLGIGLAASKDLDGNICSFIVARYYKAGNHLDTIKSNVKRGSFHNCDGNRRQIYEAGAVKEAFLKAKSHQKYHPKVKNLKGVSVTPSKPLKQATRFATKGYSKTHGKTVTMPSKSTYTHQPKSIQYVGSRLQSHIATHKPILKRKGSQKNLQIVNMHENEQKAIAYKHKLHSARKLKETSGRPMSNIPTASIMNEMSFSADSKDKNKQGKAISAIISIPNPGDFESATESESSEFEVPSLIAQASLKGTQLPQVYANHQHDYSFMFKKPKPKHLNPSGRQDVGKASKDDDEFEVNFAAPKFKSKEKQKENEGDSNGGVRIATSSKKHAENKIVAMKIQPIKPMKSHYKSTKTSHSEAQPQQESPDVSRYKYKKPSGESLTEDILGLNGDASLSSASPEKPSVKFVSVDRYHNEKPTEYKPERYQGSATRVTGSNSDQDSMVSSFDKQDGKMNSNQHDLKLPEENSEYLSPSARIQTGENMQHVNEPSSRNDFVDSLSRNLKPDGSYLSGMHAALDYDISQDKTSWEEPSTTVPIAEKLLKETSNFDDFVIPKHVDPSTKAMESEAARLEYLLSKEGSKVEENMIRNSKNGFKNGVGSKSEEGGNSPSVIMNEYNYDTPEVYGAGDLYDRKIDKEKSTGESVEHKGPTGQDKLSQNDQKVADKKKDKNNFHINHNSNEQGATYKVKISGNEHPKPFHGAQVMQEGNESHPHGKTFESSLSHHIPVANRLESSDTMQESSSQYIHGSDEQERSSDETGISNGKMSFSDHHDDLPVYENHEQSIRYNNRFKEDSHNKMGPLHGHSYDHTVSSDSSSNSFSNKDNYSYDRDESAADIVVDINKQSYHPTGLLAKQHNRQNNQNPEKSSQQHLSTANTGFRQGFKDALTKMGEDDSSELDDIDATKKNELSELPLLKGTPDIETLIAKEREDARGYKAEDRSFKAYNSEISSSGDGEAENLRSSELSRQNSHLGHNNSASRTNLSSGDIALKGDAIRRLNVNESYDANRTRHFVIDRNNNVVLEPGEDDGAVSRYEQENLAKITQQATYGLGSLENLVHDSQGIHGLEPPSAFNYDQANRPGLMAWTGPDNPGIPDEGTLNANDYTGQSTVDSFEKMADNHPLELQAFEKPDGQEQSASLEKRPESEPIGLKSTEQLNSVLDSQTGKMTGHKESGHENSQGPFDVNISQDKTVSRLQFGKDSQNSKLEEKSRNDKESISDDLKLLPDTSDEIQKGTTNKKEDAAKNKHKEDTSTFIQNALMWHNKLRCVHGSDRIKLNETLAKDADEYAKYIVSKLDGILEHSKLETRPGQGENLAMTCTGNKSTLKGAEATFKWYNDICEKGYDFKSNKVQRGTGHFTQLVWKETTDFGIGRATIKKNGRFCTVVVARYYPRGNIQEEFVDNVKQGEYDDQTCETLEKELMSDSKFVECSKAKDDSIKEKDNGDDTKNRESNDGISHGKVLSLTKPSSTSNEKQKETINQEINRVTGLIHTLEKEGKAGKTIGKFDGHNKPLILPIKSQKMKGSPHGGHGGFIGLGGTGSPVVIYHGATGFFEDPKTFANVGIETHNNLREIHGSPKVKLDIGLAAAAFQYATYLTQLGYLKHDDKIPKNQGENLAIGCYDNNSEMSAEDAVNRWYNEVCQPGYVFDNNVAESGTGHFTQVIWKATTKVGMAKQTRMHGNLKCTYVVARYSPAGNAHDEFKTNVKKGSFNETVCRDVMRGLLKFQQRNEKTIGKQEQGLKQEQATAKLQGKIMAAMQNKALQMHKNMEKQQQQTRLSHYGNADDMTSLKLRQQGIDGKLAPPFQRTPLSVNNSSLQSPGMSSILVGNNIGGSNTMKTSRLQMTTGLSPSAPEEDIKLSPLGPTVKIIEQGDHGGIMFQRIEEPKITTKSSKQKFTSATVKDADTDGSFMQNGLAGRTPSFHDSKQENPKNLQHRLVEQQTLGPEVEKLTVKKQRNFDRRQKSLKIPIEQSKSEEFDIPVANYRKSNTGSKDHLVKKPVSKLNSKERQITTTLRRPLKSPVKGLPHGLGGKARKIAANPIKGPLTSLYVGHKMEGRIPSNVVKSYANDNTRRYGESGKFITRTAELSLSLRKAQDDASSMNNYGSLQSRSEKYPSGTLFNKITQQARTYPNFKSAQNKPANSATVANSKSLQATVPSSVSSLYTPDKTFVKMHKTIAQPIPLQTSAEKLSRVNMDSVKGKNGNQGNQGNQQQQTQSTIHSGIASTNSTNTLPRVNVEQFQSKPRTQAVGQKPIELKKKPEKFSDFKDQGHPNFPSSKAKAVSFSQSSNKVKFVPAANYQSINRGTLQMHQKTFSSPHPIKGPTAFDMKLPVSSTSERPPYYITTMESPTPLSYNPKLVSNAIGQLIIGESQADKLVFQRSALESHNLYRRLHRVSPLQMNYGMSVLAEQYAKKIAQLGKLEHSGTEDGENIASVCRKDKSYMSGAEATKVWYNEVCEPGYDFVSGQPGSSGHFTQVVWKGTKQLGIGRAEAKRDGFICTFVVARYRPAGNFLGEFGKNVFRGLFDGSRCIVKKKNTIEFKHDMPKATTAMPIKRSRIPRVNATELSKRNGILNTEGGLNGRPNNDLNEEYSVNSKANAVWMPDLESGIRGSDFAGVVPLGVSIGNDENLRKYADNILNDAESDDKKTTENFAAELLNDVKKERNSVTGEKIKNGDSFSSKANIKNPDINVAREAFANMVASIKKSTPTVRYINNVIDQSPNVAVRQDNSGFKQTKAEAGDSRSDQNVNAESLLSQVNQAKESLSKAAQSIQEASKLQSAANQAKSQATEENQFAIQNSKLNEELTRIAAKMKDAAASGVPPKSDNTNVVPAAAANPGFVASPNAGNQQPNGDTQQPNGGYQQPTGGTQQPNGGNQQPTGGTQQPNGAIGGDLESSNMATANQLSSSQAAQNKKIESKNYKPSELEQSGLNAHNRLRSVHDAPPLVLNEKMSKDAAAWAKQCADTGIAKRSPTEDGENVIESCKPGNQEMTASEATETWYSELCNPGYDFSAAEITGAERFTQVVWKGTTEMGIGKVTKRKGDLLCTYIVARYHPAGNVLGDVKQNVVPGRLDSKHFCKQFLAASKFTARENDNLPSKSIQMEQADSLGSSLEEGKRRTNGEIVAGGDDPGMDGASVDKKEFRQEALYTHNRFRAVHMTSPLQIDVKMCQEAEQFAAYLASKGSLMRSKESKKGQNIAVSCNKDGIEMTGDEATNKWYNEVCNPGYDFKGAFPYGAAHFMQVIWASSKKFGIGKATTTLDDMLCTWVVGLYDPSGDMRNMQKENALMGLFDYRYCDTFGKGGGGKGPSSGAIHNIADDKIAAPAGSSATGKRKSEMGPIRHVSGVREGSKNSSRGHIHSLHRGNKMSVPRSTSYHHIAQNTAELRTRYVNHKKIRKQNKRKHLKKHMLHKYDKLNHKLKRHLRKTFKSIT